MTLTNARTNAQTANTQTQLEKACYSTAYALLKSHLLCSYGLLQLQWSETTLFYLHFIFLRDVGEPQTTTKRFIFLLYSKKYKMMRFSRKRGRGALTLPDQQSCNSPPEHTSRHSIILGVKCLLLSIPTSLPHFPLPPFARSRNWD